MGKLYVPGETTADTENVLGFRKAEVYLETPEGKFVLPVVALATFQHDIIIKEIVDQVTANVLEEVLPRLNSLLDLDETPETK
jgi:hypothetical protein